ncbi:cache domain-containing protein [bacterium]|nr:MAG: cache domain-containing protein [bacterium]QQR61471.1 MAG: cache domain-containing protein [bacterium]QQR63003.1 MAG: cache domain-containing protein [bacterium]
MKRQFKIYKYAILLIFPFLMIMPMIFADQSLENRQIQEKTKSKVGQLAIEQMKADAEKLFNKGFNFQIKEQQVMQLVESATIHLQKNDLQKACYDFSNEMKFKIGELYLFLLDSDGRIIAHGDQQKLILKNMADKKDSFGNLYVKNIIEKTDQKGTWTSYSWRNAIKKTYAKKVTKDTKEYIIGCGYYPHTKADVVVSLVKSGVQLFTKIMKDGYPAIEAFSTMNYSFRTGFSYGDLYLFALDFNGTIYAQADRPGLVGTNALNYQDSDGTFINKEIIEKLGQIENKNDGIWVEYRSKNALKKVYAQRVTDNDGKNYFIACGFYPEADQQAAVDLVTKAFQYMEGHGKMAAVEAFSNKRDNTYRYGDLSIVVYDYNGNVIAHGANDELIGRSMLKEQDEDGMFYVQRIIKQAKQGSGWIPCKLKNAHQEILVDTVNLGIEKYIITCGMFAVSKNEKMVMLVKSGIAAFESVSKIDEALSLFTNPKSGFLRGDLKVFVFDLSGVCYAWGDNKELVFKNIINWQDQNGIYFIKDMIEATKFGPCRTTFSFNGAQAIAHVERIEKQGKQYIIGSSFYM